MSTYLFSDIEKLKKMILALSAQVEESVLESLCAYENVDVKLAGKVIRTDKEVDAREIEVEDAGLKILALHQPVAIDLRFIVAVLKINNDLERIGDLAVNIAEQVMIRNRSALEDVPAEVGEMAKKARSMFRRSLDALVNLDGEMARRIFADDDEVDSLLLEVFRQVKVRIKKSPDRMDALISLLLVARHIERIADLSTNIAEDVIFMIDGEIVRHQGPENNPA